MIPLILYPVSIEIDRPLTANEELPVKEQKSHPDTDKNFIADKLVAIKNNYNTNHK